MRWLILVVRIPAVPSRHRVATWRELRRGGALQIGQGVWAMPDVPVFADGVARVVQLAHRGGGEVLTLSAAGRDRSESARLQEMFTAERAHEWAGFLSGCVEFDAQIDTAIANGELTIAALVEQEERLERLRRSHRDIKARDVFGAPVAAESHLRLERCAAHLADYAARVYRAVHQI
ncbi:Chromate resistance protein ChrB [Mycobacterium sp. SMC-21]|uniref:Chromate resistance protein ChrB n=1 Tax=unclassified Mycobacterium TaxID=2642494 RepID=UPI00387687D8